MKGEIVKYFLDKSVLVYCTHQLCVEYFSLASRYGVTYDGCQETEFPRTAWL